MSHQEQHNHGGILVIGDPHIQVTSIVNSKEMIDKHVKLARSRKPDAIVILGDVLHDHERLHTTALNMAIDWITDLAALAETWILVGNHDYVNNSQFPTEKHWMTALKGRSGIHVVDSVKATTIIDMNVVLAPFVPPGRFIEALDTLHLDGSDDWKEWKDADIIFAHQEFRGCRMGAIASEHGDVWKRDFPMVVSGHIHSNQRLQENIYYPGSAMQVSYGENSSKKTVSLIIHGPDDFEEIDLLLRRKKIVYTTIKDVPERLDNDSMSNCDVKVCVDSTKEEFKAFKKTKTFKRLTRDGVKIVFKRSRKNIKADNEALLKHVDADHAQGDFVDILKHLVANCSNTQVRNAFDRLEQLTRCASATREN